MGGELDLVPSDLFFFNKLKIYFENEITLSIHLRQFKNLSVSRDIERPPYPLMFVLLFIFSRYAPGCISLYCITLYYFVLN